jgi:hypothetical protein
VQTHDVPRLTENILSNFERDRLPGLFKPSNHSDRLSVEYNLITPDNLQSQQIMHRVINDKQDLQSC